MPKTTKLRDVDKYCLLPPLYAETCAELSHLHVVELHNARATTALTLSTFIALCSGMLGEPVQSQLVVLGSMSLGGNVIPVENLADSL